jgi:hypothetical protein
VEGTAVTDITDDLLEFTFTESIETHPHKVSTLDVRVRDTDLKYRNRLFIKKGTKVVAQWQVLYGTGPSVPRGTGDMWVDTCECELKPRTMTFKATSASPELERGGRKHKGVEGKNNKEILKSNPDFNLIGELGGTDAESDTPQKRSDQENESDPGYAARKAEESGYIAVSANGKTYYYKMADLEAQAPSYTISDGSSNILNGRIRTTNQGKFKKGKIQYMDPKTGKLLVKEVEVELDDATNAEMPAAVLNPRKRPNFEGEKDDPDPDPTTPTGAGQPGDTGD